MARDPDHGEGAVDGRIVPLGREQAHHQRLRGPQRRQRLLAGVPVLHLHELARCRARQLVEPAGCRISHIPILSKRDGTQFLYVVPVPRPPHQAHVAALALDGERLEPDILIPGHPVGIGLEPGQGTQRALG